MYLHHTPLYSLHAFVYLHNNRTNDDSQENQKKVEKENVAKSKEGALEFGSASARFESSLPFSFFSFFFSFLLSSLLFPLPSNLILILIAISLLPLRGVYAALFQKHQKQKSNRFLLGKTTFLFNTSQDRFDDCNGGAGE